MEYSEVVPVFRRIIALRCAAAGQVRFVHEFCGDDAATYRPGVGEQPPGLVRRPSAGGIAGTGADGKRGYDRRVCHSGEIDHTLPLLPGQDCVETCWRH